MDFSISLSSVKGIQKLRETKKHWTVYHVVLKKHKLFSSHLCFQNFANICCLNLCVCVMVYPSCCVKTLSSLEVSFSYLSASCSSANCSVNSQHSSPLDLVVLTYCKNWKHLLDLSFLPTWTSCRQYCCPSHFPTPSLLTGVRASSFRNNEEDFLLSRIWCLIGK